MKGQEEKQSISSQAASRASRSAPPGSEEALLMTVISGLRCLESSKSSAPLGCLERMLLVSSIWGSTRRYLTWNEKDTPQKRLYYRLVASARGMNAQERLSWALMFPTPLASDTGKDAKYLNVYLSENGVFRKVNPNGTKWSLPLSAAVYYLTPMASDGYRSTLRPESMMKSKPNSNLATQMIHLERPQDHDAALNPDWVEWLMGFPRRWTDIEYGGKNPKTSLG